MEDNKMVKYPIDEEEFATRYAAKMGGSKETLTYARLLAKELNEAYQAGIREGRRTKAMAC